MGIGIEFFALGEPEEDDLVIIEGQPGTGHEQTMLLKSNRIRAAKAHCAKDPSLGAWLDLVALGQKDLVKLTETSLQSTQLRDIYLTLLRFAAGDVETAEGESKIESMTEDQTENTFILDSSVDPEVPASEDATDAEESDVAEAHETNLNVEVSETLTAEEYTNSETPAEDTVAPSSNETLAQSDMEPEAGASPDAANLETEPEANHQVDVAAVESLASKVITLVKQTLESNCFNKFIEAAGDSPANWICNYKLSVASYMSDSFSVESAWDSVVEEETSSDKIIVIIEQLSEAVNCALAAGDLHAIDCLLEPFAKIFFEDVCHE